MSPRSLLLLPAVLGAIALPAAPALAGENGDNSGSATLHASTGACVSGDQAKAWVTGDSIAKVAFFVDGNRVKTVTQPSAGGRYLLSMRCSRLSVGAHRARAVVSFEGGSRKTLRFLITRSSRTSPRFTG